jgi:6-pyruvoyl-tetrahydropterin synthase
MYEARVRETICIAHRVPLEGGGEGPLHGHNWTIELDVGVDTLDERGRVTDLDALRARLHAVVDPLDHRTLGDLPPFEAPASRTAPAVARWVAEQVAVGLDPRVALLTTRVLDGAGGSAAWTPERPR